MQLYNNEYYQRRTPHYCSKTKCTLINTRTQATLALGARWNGWGAFLSSSKRNTLWEKESSQLYTVEMPYYY